MTPNPLADAVAREVRVPARLEVATPWELPQGHKDAIAQAIAGEAWLERLGLEGLITGVTNSDMRVFKSSCERLAGMLRYARQEGERAAREKAAELAAHWAAEARARQWIAAGGGFFAGAAILALVNALVF